MTEQEIQALDNAIAGLPRNSYANGNDGDRLLSLLDHLPAEVRPKIEAMVSRRAAFQAEVRRLSDAQADASLDHVRMQRFAARSADELRHMPDLTQQERDHLAAKTRDMGFRESQRVYDDFVADKRAGLEKAAAREAAKVADAKTRLDRATAAYTAASERCRGLDCLGPCAAWIERTIRHGDTIKHVAPPPVTLTPGKGGDYAAAVAEIRQRLAATDSALDVVNQAPAPKADFLARALQEITELADRGAISIDLHARHVRPLGLEAALSVAVQNLVVPGEQAGNGVPALPGYMAARLIGDPAPVLAWLLRPIIVERITAAIDAADDAGAMDDATREKKVAQITAQRLSLGREEEAAICAAESIGQFIPRRADADARCVLECVEA